MIFNKQSYKFKYYDNPLSFEETSLYDTDKGNVFERLKDEVFITFDNLQKECINFNEEHLLNLVKENPLIFFVNDISGQKFLSVLEYPAELIDYIKTFETYDEYDNIKKDILNDYENFVLFRDDLLKKTYKLISKQIDEKGYVVETDIKRRLNDVLIELEWKDTLQMLENCPVMLGHFKDSFYDVIDYPMISDTFLDIDFFYSHDHNFLTIQQFYLHFSIIPEYLAEYYKNKKVKNENL